MSRGWLETSLRLSAIEQAWKDQIKNTTLKGLTIKQGYVLSHLYDEDGQKPSELAKQVGCAATSFTPVLDDIESLGLIKRRADNSDRRAVNILLTEKGKSVKVIVCEAIDAVEKAFK